MCTTKWDEFTMVVVFQRLREPKHNEAARQALLSLQFVLRNVQN